MACDFNKRVVKQPLKVGDLVLRKMEVSRRAKELGKLTPDCEGPYLIVQEVRSGTFRLQDMDGRPI